MAKAILMPRQGNSVESCLIIEWKKKKGDRVSEGEIICEVETDKAVFEVEATESGTLLDVFFEEGDDVPVLSNIAVIGEEGENYENLRPSVVSESEDALEESSVISSMDEEVERVVSETSVTAQSEGNVVISPRAKRLANSKGLNPNLVFGSGPLGRVIERDIIESINNLQPLTPAAKDAVLSNGKSVPTEGSGIGGRITSFDILSSSSKTNLDDKIKEEPIKGVRKIIAVRMLESLQNSAQLTLNSSADATTMLTLRKTYKTNKLDSRFIDVSINDILTFAVVKTLPKNPVINSLFSENIIQYYENIHLGFAVDTARGLLVPTIRNSQKLNLLDLSNETKRLANACRENKIQVEELSGATFTITNLGNMGIDSFTPVLNLPQTAILGVGQINLKPIKTGDEVEFIPHIGLSLTINHQVIDGAQGAKFLQDLSETIKEIDILVNTK